MRSLQEGSFETFVDKLQKAGHTSANGKTPKQLVDTVHEICAKLDKTPATSPKNRALVRPYGNGRA